MWVLSDVRPSGAPGARSEPIQGLRAEAWNGKDFYVSFGQGQHRSWEDAREYGFIAAGQGEWYSRTLGQLSSGDRVFVHIPKEGYVGVGEVTREKTAVTDFDVDVDGERKNILELSLDAEHMDENAEDPELREYLVGVEWKETRPVSKAYWETGMYANQNSVTKLRNQFTLNRLYQEFDIDS